MAYSLAVWVTLWRGNAYLSCWLDLWISWFKFPVRRLIVGLIAMTVYTTLMVYLLMLAFQWVFNAQWPPEVIVSNIKFSLLITLIISAFMHARFFLANWKKSELDAEKMKNESLSSKYESLKNQVNPHFLFNSFNALVDLIYHDQDTAAKFVKQLSVVYRYVLEQQEKEVVPLEDELTFVKSYLFLEKIRYGDNLQVHYSVDINALLTVPPMSIQMLVENAIKHNIISREEPLTIDIRLEGSEYIVVSNNLQKKQVSANNSTGVGLKNIKARYQFLTNKLVQILEEKDHFTVKLPFLQIQAE
ncbi:histidine kinase [Fulvivirgaceae bacterium BMA12]|uniref:Histidine kinase n=1 Tax=Agaribacillus aureus TaxID=3051825 RepID=A0ABT8LCU7_9BACT|nr:histidine kinase [Fulvivirgaceae bacterium BMA12]